MIITISNKLKSLENDVNQIQEYLRSEPEISYAYSSTLININEVIGKCYKPMLNDDLGNKHIQEIRNEFALLRLEIRKSMSLLESKLRSSVDAYRSALGDQKEAFEKLSESEQKNAHPDGYNALQRFHKINLLKDKSQEISEKLMDLSSEIEHQSLQEEETPPIEHFDLKSNVPSPSSLSP
ncbi:hypothetical protein [Paenibacillus sp. GP183]|jgi:hypothetical protein|uniref:hypothetical protein n=1 Tax=Paenibacillus sp. GP183 TaxID=1882751 RepID=UPI00089CC387|nr:hypothetical protein [Paenibacillus sp. GP183]SEB51063.1 hypothetical protein SAMN05443246_0781 [Paenibacillus sp. GP183]